MEFFYLQDLRGKETQEARHKCNEQKKAVGASFMSYFADHGKIIGLLCHARAVRLKAERLYY